MVHVREYFKSFVPVLYAQFLLPIHRGPEQAIFPFV